MKRKRLDRPVRIKGWIPASLEARIDMLLWSDLEQRMPHRAWSDLVEGLLRSWLKEQGTASQLTRSQQTETAE